MKRLLTLGLIPLILGICGSVLRAYELAYVFDPTTGLPSNPMPVTSALIALGIIMAAIALGLAFVSKPIPQPEKKSPLFQGIALFTFAILLGFSASLFRTALFSQAMTDFVFAILTLISGVSIAITGIMHLKNRTSSLYALFAAIPVFWACFALILVFRTRISDPVIADYIYVLFALICILLFTYTQTGYIYRKNRLRITIISTVLGVYFCVIELLSPYIALRLSATYTIPAINLTEIIPLLAFFVYMPFAAAQMLKNENNV